MDPGLTDEKRRVACRGERNPQGTIFRQPTVSEVAIHEKTERERDPGAEELSWEPKRLQATRPDPVSDTSEEIHPFA